MKKTQQKHSKFFRSLFQPREIFSIRKLSFGVTSILLGSFFIGGQLVHAEELSQKTETPQILVEESISTEAPTEVAVDDTSTKVVEVVPESEVATIELNEASEISESPVDTNQESVVKENVVTESSIEDITEYEDGKSTVLNNVETSDEKLSELSVNLSNESTETSVDTLLEKEALIENDEASLVNNDEANSASVKLDTSTYSDRSASEEDPKVEDENQKRLKYFAELNSSGFSRIEIPEGMTTIVENAFSGNQKLKEIVLPSTLTTIGYGAFENSGLEKVILPASLTYIGDRAFAGISTLKEVVIPKNVTYAPNIFTGSNNLKKVTFEDGITVIPASILAGSSVEEIQLPSSVETIDSYAFSENKYLKKINLKDGVKAIHSGAFAGNTSLAQVELPEGLEYIADSAFNGTTSLTSIVIPTSVKGISYSAFFDSGLTSIQLPENLETIDNYAFSSTRLSEVKLPASLKYLGFGAFSGIDSLKKVEVNSDIATSHYSNSWSSPFASSPLTVITIKDGVTVVADRMFEGQSGITSLTLPSSLLEVRPYAFTGIGIESLSLPAGLQKLGTHSFADSPDLKSVNIPSGLSEGDGAFINSKRLVDITFSAGTTKIIDGLFRGTGFSEFTIPEGITEIGANAFADNGNLTTIILPSTLRTIGVNAFANTSLKRIVLPPGMKKIPDGLLQGTKVEEFVIPEGVEEIGDLAFANNSSLKSVVLPSSLKKIGYGAFQNTGLESITFKDGLVEIGSYAFSNTHLQSVVLPNTVTSLGESAFSRITELTSLSLSEGLTEIKVGTFSDTSLERVTIPSAVTVIHDSAFSGIGTLKDISFSNGLKRIESYAFAGTGLTDVTLPSQLEYLGSKAFGTESLRSIHIPKSLKEVGTAYYWEQGPFTGATNLQKVTFETGINQIVANLFMGAHIESLDLPATIEEIGNFAFSYSALEKITLPGSIKEIGNAAFYRTNLESIDIPDSVIEIGVSAFAESLRLKQAKLSASMKYVPASMFSATSLSSIEIPTGVERIDGEAFSNTKLHQVNLPESLKEIGGNAFSTAPLTSVSFPSSLEKIGDGAFWKTSLVKVTIPDSLKELGSGVFSEIATLKEAHVAKDFVGGNHTFAGSVNLEKVTFEEGRTAIPREFLANTGIKEVILPKELKVIGSGAFRSTNNLKEIDLGDKLEELREEAFQYSGLTRVTLPDSLTVFGYRAFANSSFLREVKLPDTLNAIPEEAFRDTGLLSLTLPSSVTHIEREAFANAKISIIDFSTGLETIGSGAFSGNQFEKLELPKSLKELGYSAFSDNKNLTFLYINSDLEHGRYGSYDYGSPFKHTSSSIDAKNLYVEFKEGVTKIPAYLFDGAKQVIRVDLPEGLKVIGESAFRETSIMKDESLISIVGEESAQNAPFDAVSMTRLELPDSLEKIGNHAFGKINTLTSINIPKNLIEADQAFAGSRNLTHLRNNVEGIRIPDGMLEETGIATFIVPEGVTEIGKYALRNNKTTDKDSVFGDSSSEPVKWAGLTNVILPSTLTKIDSRTFESTSIKFIDVPNGVSEIGDGAFRFNTELETVKLPKELKKLGGYLFEGNEKMTLLVLPDKVESIDVNAFVNMPNLEKVYIPASVNSIGENLIFNPNTTFYVTAGSYAEKYMKERNIPYEIAGDDYKHYNDGIVKSSRFSVASQTLKQSGRLALDLNYSLATAGRAIADKEIRITLPKGAVAFEKTIKIDGKEQEAIIENDILIIKNSSDSGRIRFVVTTKVNELTQLQLAAQVLYKEYGIQKSEVLGHLNEEIPFLMIKADTVTPSYNAVRVVGRTKPNTKVIFEVIDLMIGDQKIDTYSTRGEPVISDMTGQFQANVSFDIDSLRERFESEVKSFKIRAVAEVDGVQVKSDSESVSVSNDAPVLIQFLIRHNGQELDLLDNKANENVIFRPNSKFEFQVKFYNSEDISRVWVNTVRNGVKKRIQLGQKGDIFTASAYFDDSNHDFIPSGFTVEVEKTYNKDKDGDGLLDAKRMTADDRSKNKWLTDNGYPSLIDSNSDSWDVSDRDLAIFAALAYEDYSTIGPIFSKYDSDGNLITSLTEEQKSKINTIGQLTNLYIGNADESLFIKWRIFDYHGQAVSSNPFETIPLGVFGNLDGLFTNHVVFVDENNENVVISLRGTDEGITEFIDDLSILEGKNKHKKRVREQMLTILEMLNARKVEYKNIYVTGHSLGGFLAYHAADELMLKVGDKVRKVVNFNGPGLNIDKEKFEVARLLTSPILGTGVYHYRVVGDALNWSIVNSLITTFGTFHPSVTKEFQIMHLPEGTDGHNLHTFFYYLDRGYRTSKGKFLGSKFYPLLEKFHKKLFVLNLPETPNYVIDPSGRVLNSVTGKPVVNATAKVYYKDKDGKEVLWNAGDYSQLNPVLTTIHGEYAWDVPEGLWKVKIEKDGYEVTESDWLPVPPPQTEVNFNLRPKTYSLEFVLDGGKATSILPTSYMTEVEFALPLAEKEGYDFLGWFDNEAKTGKPVTNTLFSSVGNKKLWAGWDIPLVTAVPDTAPTTPELPSVKIETKVRRVETVLTTDVVDYYDDPTLADHLTREDPGTTGLLVTELTDYYVDGMLVRTDTKEISRTEAIPKKVYRGTKHVTAVPDTAPTAPELPSVKIETKVRRVETVLTTDVVDYYDDPTLADHLTREDPGTTGLLVTELTDYYVDGVLVRTDTKEISRTEATPKRVYRGTKHVTAVPDTAPTTPELPSVKIETKVRRVETVLATDVVDYYDDPTLADHLTREEPGTTGLLVTELTDYYVDGLLVRTDTKEISRTEATPKKVYRTKHVTQVPDSAPTTPELPSVKIETKVHRVETVLTTDMVDYYDDPTLADHLTREEPGTTGLLVTELTDYYVDGVLVRTDTKEISRTEATPKKVYRGTKHVTQVPDSAPTAPILPTITTRKEERSITTSKIIHLEDADLVVGQIREEEGRPGVVIVEIIDYYVDGKIIKTEEVIVSREEATPKIHYHGTKHTDPINTPESIQSDAGNSKVVETQKSDSNRELPQTGQENSIFPSVLGLCLLSVGTALIKSRKDENTKG
ncbi:leucine-rich repeat protein [Streptococcus suis]|nr:leucine-rich repeat protein [Streptococcus suis]